jgi:hypothetical protein
MERGNGIPKERIVVNHGFILFSSIRDERFGNGKGDRGQEPFSMSSSKFKIVICHQVPDNMMDQGNVMMYDCPVQVVFFENV